MMRIAWSTASRITGSPTRAISRRIVPPATGPRVPAGSPRPVSISAQVEALTNSDSLWPRCGSSRLRRACRGSAVAGLLSGMRSSASARHISATPSGVESPYSRGRHRFHRYDPFWRSSSTKSLAVVAMCCLVSGVIWSPFKQRFQPLLLVSPKAAPIAARRGIGAGIDD